LKGLKGGPALPAWALWVAIAVGVVVIVVIGYRALSAGGPRDPRTFPKEAYQPPGYSAKSGGSPYGQRPSSPAQAGGNPYSGAYGNRPGGPSQGGSPYSGAYGNRPGGPPQGGANPYGGAYGNRPGGN